MIQMAFAEMTSMNDEFLRRGPNESAGANYHAGGEVGRGHCTFLNNASSLETNLDTKGINYGRSGLSHRF